ncbi:MAG: class I SAM-dependent methyltransferase [Planctomycetota bacterium]
MGQLEWEICSLLMALRTELKPRKAIELGTCSGASAVLFGMVTSGQVVSVDISSKKRTESRENVSFVEGDTHSVDTIQAVKDIVGDSVDFLFIDAGHLYDQVKKDFEMWSPLVRPGGWIAFHDVDPRHVAPNVCQVNRFWQELPGNKSEWIQTTAQVREEGYAGAIGCGGIGLLRT